MKFRTVVLTALILIAGIINGAKVIPPRPFHLDRDVTINGAAVPQGMYTLAVESQGALARATLLRDGRFVATAQGIWVKHGIKYAEDAVLLRVNPDGTRSLIEIRLKGSQKSIVIESESPILQVSPGRKGGGGGTSNTRTIN
jgi:hypothetical protein